MSILPKKESENFKAFAFDDIIEFAKGQKEASIVNGVPWNFTFNNHVFTHSNDDKYIVIVPSKPHLFFNKGEVLVFFNDGQVSAIEEAAFLKITS